MKIIVAILLIGAGAWLIWQGGISFNYTEKNATVIDVGIAQVKGDVPRTVRVDGHWGWAGVVLGGLLLLAGGFRR